MIMRLALVAAFACVAGIAPAHAASIDAAAATRFAQMALDCVHREYPNKIAHVLMSDADARPPRELTPAFYGCYDWHSSVHGHWLLARVAHLFPNEPVAAKAREALAISLTPEHIATELTYLQAESRASFERPYGLAWLLQLGAELRTWDDPQAGEWAKMLAPLEAEAATHLKLWLPKLRYPIRIGEHDQTAFAFGLVWDWAKVADDAQMQALLSEKAQQFYSGDRACPLAYEPSGQDFLSPCLSEADLMRRVLDKSRFATWLSAFLPQIPTNGSTGWLHPGEVTDRTDPKLAHLDGLNLSRGWMLQGIANALPQGDRRIGALRATAEKHRDASLEWVSSGHYVGSHWLGTFAMYGASP
jgi:hypothetical protein